MTLTDPIADMLTVVRNANAIRQAHVDTALSKVKVGIAVVMKEEGYIRDYEVVDVEDRKKLRVHLKYGPHGEQIIREIRRESKPGKRVYKTMPDLPKVLNGLGTAIFSTPQGILSDKKCRAAKVGGEWLCTVY